MPELPRERQLEPNPDMDIEDIEFPARVEFRESSGLHENGEVTLDGIDEAGLLRYARTEDGDQLRGVGEAVKHGEITFHSGAPEGYVERDDDNVGNRKGI